MATSKHFKPSKHISGEEKKMAKIFSILISCYLKFKKTSKVC